MSQQPTPAETPTPAIATPSNRKPIILLVLTLLLVTICVVGYRAWSFGATHAVTDDAQLTSDVISMSSQISASVVTVPVVENQNVKAGDVLCTMDTSALQAAYNLAKANLDAAVSAAQQAQTAVSLATDVGNAQELSAVGVLSQAESGIQQAKADVVRSQSGVENAEALRQSAVANVALTKSALKAAEASLQHARETAEAARAQVSATQAAVGSAQSAQDAATAVSDRTAHDATRYARLFDEGAVSEQTSENASYASQQARAQLENTKHGVTQARAAVAQAQSNLRAAQQQIESSIAAVDEARARIEQAKSQTAGAEATVRQAKAQLEYARQGIGQAIAKQKQAVGGRHQAATAPEQVSETQSAHAQAMARIEQAKAALETARIQLSYTRIVAPVSGRISKKTVEVGQYAQPGTPFMSIIPDNDIWITANYKETQLVGVKAGSPATIDVDGIPGVIYKGHVESISAGTGATFALLPPDNSTGNFTKVVQRVAVKIVIDNNQPGQDKLRAGMSVSATIDTR